MNPITIVNLKKEMVGLDGVPLTSTEGVPLTVGVLLKVVLNYTDPANKNKDVRWDLLKRIQASAEGELSLTMDQVEAVLDAANAAITSPSIYGLLKEEIVTH